MLGWLGKGKGRLRRPGAVELWVHEDGGQGCSGSGVDECTMFQTL